MKALLAALLTATALTTAAAEWCFSANTPGLELRNGAQTAGGIIDLTGKRSFAVLHGTEKLDLSRGGTLTAECRFTDLDRNPGKFRFLFNKDNAFLFGLTGGKYNFSLCDNGRWSLAVIGGELPPGGEWLHLAAVARRIEDKEQGKIGFQLEVFVNGEKILSKFTPCTALHTDVKSAVQLGTASKDTRFAGEAAQVQFFDRALTPAEIRTLAQSGKFARITIPGQYEVPADIQQRTQELTGKSADKLVKFTAGSLARAALAGVPAEKVRRGLTVAEQWNGAGDFPAYFNAKQPDFRLLAGPGGTLFAVNGECGRAFPVIDIFDPAAGTGIFGPRAGGFRIRHRDNTGKSRDDGDFAAAGITSQIGTPDSRGNVPLQCRWNCPGKWEALLAGSWGPGGLRLTLEVAPQPGTALESVTFPQWNFARKKGRDYLVTPYMSGRLIANPIDNYSYEREYPCAQISMLFQAYYGEKGDGVYAALEDPDAVVHTIGVGGKSDQLCTLWRTPVPAGGKFKLPGEAVVRTFRGDWYTAARLYREFAAKASWWIKELPRTSTPEWLRNNSIWILAGVYPSRNIESMLYLREYFEQEFGVHYIGTAERAWPHFDRTTEHALGKMKQLQAAGLKVIPYADPRLWREAVQPDGSIGTTPLWEPGAEELAIKQANGKPLVEKYGKYSCLVLCPAAPAWQKTYIEICSNLAKKGFNGIYHDQLPCGHFDPCYSTGHGHLPADPAAWVTNGYAPFYRNLTADLRRLNPELFHTGEDGSEPFLNLIDGFTAWRWVESDQIPLFQTVYSGRIQITGKLYNHQYPGDWESNFAKAASQLVNAEQLGWITLEDLEIATPFRKFFKTLAWYRRALLEYFNAGERLAPLKFTRDPGMMTSIWGNTSGQGQAVTTPKIQHAVYRLADGRVMALFVNTTPEVQQAAVQWPYGVNNLRLCRPAEAASIPADTVPELKLAPYTGEVWLVSPRDNRQEADAAAAVWHRADSFDEGKNLHWRRMVKQKVPAELTVKSGALNSVMTAAEVRESAKRYYANGTDKDPLLHLTNQSMLRYENVRCESGEIRRLAIVAAWTPAETGGAFEIRSAGRTLGRIALDGGQRYLEFKEVAAELSEPLAPGSDLEIIFTGKSCRFKGFKVFISQQE